MSPPVHRNRLERLLRRTLLSAMEQRFLWRTYLGEVCCNQCAMGNTAECDVNPLALVPMTRVQAVTYLQRAELIP